jgi:hypothetical protein
MAVDNLPNELPCDASEYFGQHFEKYVLPDCTEGGKRDTGTRYHLRQWPPYKAL